MPLARQPEEQDVAARFLRRPNHRQRPARVVVEPGASEHGQLVQILVLDRPTRDQPALGEKDRDVAGTRCRRRERANELRIANRLRPDPPVEEVLPDNLRIAGSTAGSSDVDPNAADLAARDPDRRRPGHRSRAPCAPAPRVEKTGHGEHRGQREHVHQTTHPPTPFGRQRRYPAAAVGSSSQKTEPSPLSLSKFMLPPWASTTDRAIVRPRPVPGIPLAGASPRKNFTNTRSCWSSGIPRPSSRTLTRTTPFSCSATTCTVPPSGEYLIALDRRLPTTCASRFGSPRTVSGVGGITMSSSCFSLCPSKRRTCSVTTRDTSISSGSRIRWPSSSRSASRKSLRRSESLRPSRSMISR